MGVAMIKKYAMEALLVFAVGYIGAMDVMSQETMFQIYGIEGEKQKIEISNSVLQLSSALKNMVEDLGGDNSIAIPIVGFSIATIQRLITILELYTTSASPIMHIKQTIEVFSSAELIDIINCANHLLVNENVLKVFGDTIGEIINKNQQFNKADYDIFTQLSADFVKKFVSPVVILQIVGYSKIRIMKKNESERKWFIENEPVGLTTGAFSGIFANDDKWVVFGALNSVDRNCQLTFYDALNREKLSFISGTMLPFSPPRLISHEKFIVYAPKDSSKLLICNMLDINKVFGVLFDHPEQLIIQSMRISPDGKYLVIVYDGPQNNIIVIPIKSIDWTGNPLIMNGDELYRYTAKVGHWADKILFESDKPECKIVSYQNNTIEVTHVNYESGIISSQSVDLGSLVSYICFGFSHDSKYIVAALGFKDRLKIVVFDSVTLQKIKEFDGPMSEGLMDITFSPDDQWIVYTNLKKLFVYDFSDGQLLAEVEGLFENHSMSFSSDGNKILLAGFDPGIRKQYYGLLWTLLTDQENAILQKLYNGTIDQIILVRQLCDQLFKKDIAIITDNSIENNIFSSLDLGLQNFFKKIGVVIRQAGEQTLSEWLESKTTESGLYKYIQKK